jgi:quercetin dioxygenase-like cupin family protein
MARKKMVVVDPEKIEWERVKNPKAPKTGILGKLLSLDEKTGAMALLAKLPKGFHQSEHTHPSDAHVMVLEGRVVDGKANEIKKGMYWFIPAGVEHGPEDSPEGCVAFIYFNGPAW